MDPFKGSSVGTPCSVADHCVSALACREWSLARLAKAHTRLLIDWRFIGIPSSPHLRSLLLLWKSSSGASILANKAFASLNLSWLRCSCCAASSKKQHPCSPSELELRAL